MTEDLRPIWIQAWEDLPMTERERLALIEQAKTTPEIVERLRRRKLLDQMSPPAPSPEGQ